MTMYSVLRDDANKVGIKKVGVRTSLLWKLCEKNEQISMITWKAKMKTERVVFREVWAASPADARRRCEEKRVEQ